MSTLIVPSSKAFDRLPIHIQQALFIIASILKRNKKLQAARKASRAKQQSAD